MENYKKNKKILEKSFNYKAEMEHDACGVGLIASTNGKKSRKIIEYGTRDELFNNPTHPYTKALLSSIPNADPGGESSREKIVLRGDIPNPANLPSGCVFRTRCPLAISECSLQPPEKLQVAPAHYVSCIRAPMFN